jgi:hypothetical protein
MIAVRRERTANAGPDATCGPAMDMSASWRSRAPGGRYARMRSAGFQPAATPPSRRQGSREDPGRLEAGVAAGKDAGAPQMSITRDARVAALWSTEAVASASEFGCLTAARMGIRKRGRLEGVSNPVRITRALAHGPPASRRLTRGRLARAALAAHSPAEVDEHALLQHVATVKH